MVFAGLMVVLIPLSTFSFTSFCTACGAAQDTTEWQIPLTSITYWRTDSVRDTPLSLALARAGLAEAPVHTWAFAFGRGNGTMCALGKGHDLVNIVYSAQLVMFMEAVARYQGRAIAEVWRDRLLDPKKSSQTATQIYMANPPAAGFTGQAEFEKWWRGNAEVLTPQEVGEETGTAPASRPANGAK